jgi:alpha-amylase/alpha-mannosidase (GH57 family)
VYNHIILPLAKKRDKLTQILWGIADFEHHYGRKPEGMWLSEAAVDRESCKLMSDHGILFTVLAPHQARRVRPVGFAQPWRHLRHEGVDPRAAFRLILEGGRQFHVFFYDGVISRAIAFQGLLHSGDQLAQSFMNAFSRRDRAQLVSAAVDGETFGHHHKFGEMAVAFGLKKIRDQRMARITNYAYYLDREGSSMEADIHENSSWSCAHGVERWRSDCGCRMNHEAGWNQRWRAVLRDALEWLQGMADEIYESQTQPFFRDPWQARNEYIRVMLDPSEKERKRFLSKVCKKTPSREEELKLWRLLEAQKFTLFMFTSCGWFFDDISGIEPVQMMKFACRAAELIQPFSKKTLLGDLSGILAKAQSNIPEMGSGKDVFERFVVPGLKGVAHGV